MQALRHELYLTRFSHLQSLLSGRCRLPAKDASALSSDYDLIVAYKRKYNIHFNKYQLYPFTL